MKVVVDEGVPKNLVFALREVGIDVDIFPGEWRGFANGKLIAAAQAAGYGALVNGANRLP